MQYVKKVICTALILLAVAGTVFAGAKREGIEEIRKTGILKVGVKSDVPKLGLLDTASNQYEGLEIELAKLIAQDLLGDPNKLACIPVTAKTRGPLLDNGDIDLVIATFTITEERKLTYNFSSAYYTDAVGMLVKKSKGFSGFADLNGKTIGIAQSSTSKEILTAAANETGISLNFAEFATYPEIKAALDSGRIDGFSVDTSILNGYLDSESEILPDRFAPQAYGVVSKLSNKELAAYIDRLIQRWLQDGTIADLITKFGL